MGKERTHHVTTTDDVTIGGTIHGQGPPLVFVHGNLGDGDLDWQALLPHLTDRFTCHLPNSRGRGLSGDHPDHSFGRLVDDVIAYVESLGEPTGLVGWSVGASLAFTATAQSDAVTAIAPFELGVQSLIDEQERAAIGAALARAGELVADGDLTGAMRAFAAGWPFNDEEIAVAEETGYFEAAGRYVPNLLTFFQQARGYQGPSPGDPAVLDAISVPVLALHGSDTRPWFIASARYLADNVTGATVHEIPGAGHAAPLTHPVALAEAVTGFFSSVQRPT